MRFRVQKKLLTFEINLEDTEDALDVGSELAYLLRGYLDLYATIHPDNITEVLEAFVYAFDNPRFSYTKTEAN